MDKETLITTYAELLAAGEYIRAAELRESTVLSLDAEEELDLVFTLHREACVKQAGPATVERLESFVYTLRHRKALKESLTNSRALHNGLRDFRTCVGWSTKKLAAAWQVTWLDYMKIECGLMEMPPLLRHRLSETYRIPTELFALENRRRTRATPALAISFNRSAATERGRQRPTKLAIKKARQRASQAATELLLRTHEDWECLASRLPVDVTWLVEHEHGADIDVEQMDSDIEARAFPREKVIQINGQLAFDARLWFTVAHELGHLVLHAQTEAFHDRTADLDPKHFSRARGGRIFEIEANAFAAELLMPARLVCDHFERRGLDPAELARTFDVSHAAMAWRLFDLGLDFSVVQQKRLPTTTWRESGIEWL